MGQQHTELVTDIPTATDGIDPSQLLDRDEVRQEVHPGAAVLLRHEHPEQTRARPSRRRSRAGTRRVRSRSAAPGRTRSSAKERTMSCTICCCSSSAKSIWRLRWDWRKPTPTRLRYRRLIRHPQNGVCFWRTSGGDRRASCPTLPTSARPWRKSTAATRSQPVAGGRPLMRRDDHRDRRRHRLRVRQHEDWKWQPWESTGNDILPKGSAGCGRRCWGRTTASCRRRAWWWGWRRRTRRGARCSSPEWPAWSRAPCPWPRVSTCR